MKKFIALFLVLALALSLMACGVNETATSTPEKQGQAVAGSPAPEKAEAADQPKVLHVGSTWLYATLNPHLSFQGWETYGYGLNGNVVLCG